MFVDLFLLLTLLTSWGVLKQNPSNVIMKILQQNSNNKLSKIQLGI